MRTVWSVTVAPSRLAAALVVFRSADEGAEGEAIDVYERERRALFGQRAGEVALYQNGVRVARAEPAFVRHP